jgi:UDP-xylose/UDP-N-acetylglucosamine transporter B4
MSDGGTGDVERRKVADDTSSNTTNTMTPRRKHRPSNGHLSAPLRRTKSYDVPEGNPDQRDLALAIASTLLPSWLSPSLLGILTLIFGGCCSNVFALEAIISSAPQSGTLITFTQVLFTALFTLPAHIDFSRGIQNLYLKPRHIPLTQWALFAALFITINILNNKAFGYHISVPLHIILRSAGPVATMSVGYLAGKRYLLIQVLAVLLLFLGVVAAAISDARAKGASIQLLKSDADAAGSSAEFWTGFSILFLALLLSAFMGLFTDRLYAKHGRGNSEENLFYSHLLSLPIFLFRLPSLQAQISTLAHSPSSTLFFSQSTQDHIPGIINWLLALIPIQLLFLLLNGLTQYLCIRGVNQLSAQTSSLTVGIVLNIRKLVSLLLSIWLFGNKLDGGVLAGAGVVFIGGALYAWPAGEKVERGGNGKEGQEGEKQRTGEGKKEL